MKHLRYLITFGAWVLGASVATLAVRLVLGALSWLDGGFGATEVIVFDAIRLAFPVAFALVLSEWVQRRTTALRIPRWFLVLTAWLVGAVAGSLSFHVIAESLRWLDQPFGLPRVIGDALLLAVAIAGALLLSSWVKGHALPGVARLVSRPFLRQTMFGGLLGLYLITWAFGVPAVTTSLFRRDLARYKSSALITDPDYRRHYPVITASFGVPLLPGIVLVYYESQLGGQSGAGGWHLFAWWGLSERSIAFYMRWVS